jgi:hypothetical protein
MGRRKNNSHEGVSLPSQKIGSVKSEARSQNKILSLAIGKIRAEPGTQPRERLDESFAQDLAEILQDDPDSLPPVVVFHDEAHYFLADGFHRLRAHVIAKRKTISAEIHQGDRRQAVLFALGSNKKHGLRMTNEDKRRAVRILLEDQEWARWSNRSIGLHCGVSDFMVRQWRVELHAQSETITFRRDGQMITIPARKSQKSMKGREEAAISRRGEEGRQSIIERIDRSLKRISAELVELDPDRLEWNFSGGWRLLMAKKMAA